MKHITFTNAIRVLILIPLLILIGCGSSSPESFVKAFDSNWSSISIREDLNYDEAWGQTIDVVARDFEMEMISKEGGYARSGWVYTWLNNGEYNENYRVRVVYKFSPDRTVVDLKTEAQQMMDGVWVTGYDTRLLQTVKSDIMGVVGRTTM